MRNLIGVEFAVESYLEKAGISKNELDIRSSWTKDMIIRYFYVKLAPHFRRDVKFFLASEEEQCRQYNEGFMFNGPEVVCGSICEFYHQLFKDFGIRSQIIKTVEKKVPHFALIVEGTNGWYFIDPLKDLLANQLGFKPNYFATNPEEDYNRIYSRFPEMIKIPSQELEEIDKSLELYPAGENISEYFRKIKVKYINPSSFSRDFGVDKKDPAAVMMAKLSFISASMLNIGRVNGPCERCQYHKYLRSLLFDKNDSKHVSIHLNRDLSDPHVLIGFDHDVSQTHREYYEQFNQDGGFGLLLK